MWTTQKHQIEESYNDLVKRGAINPDKTLKDDYMYEAWHNWSRSTPNDYFKNFRDDAAICINLVAISILVHHGLDSYSIKRIHELHFEMLR